MKIVIAAGGSGGHLFPALGLAYELSQRDEETEFIFLLSERSEDWKIFRRVTEESCLKWPESSVNAFMLPVRPKGAGGLDSFIFLVKLFQGFVASASILCRERPSVAVGFGGYISGPILLLAALSRIPTLIHEQNVLPGRTNRILSRFVDEIAVSFEETRDFFKKRKGALVVTGNPLRPDLSKVDRNDVLKKFDFKEDKFTILVMGGSRGSHKINKVFMESLVQMGDKREKLQAIHLTGEADYGWVKREYERIGVKHQVFSFLHDVSTAYHITNLVIARAGATSISEITSFGLPAILIPYPYARYHQKANAKVLNDAGAAMVIEEKELSSAHLKRSIVSLVEDNGRRSEMAEKSQRLKIPDAAEKLADEVISLLHR